MLKVAKKGQQVEKNGQTSDEKRLKSGTVK